MGRHMAPYPVPDGVAEQNLRRYTRAWTRPAARALWYLPWHRVSDWLAGCRDGRRQLPRVLADDQADPPAAGTHSAGQTSTDKRSARDIGVHGAREATVTDREPLTAHVVSLIKVFEDRA